jgi:hypothetical protein
MLYFFSDFVKENSNERENSKKTSKKTENSKMQ